DMLADQVRDDRDGHRADRHVRHGGVDGMSEPRPVEESLDRADRMEERRQPAMVEVAEGLRPAGLGIDRAVDIATDHRSRPPFPESTRGPDWRMPAESRR